MAGDAFELEAPGRLAIAGTSRRSTRVASRERRPRRGEHPTRGVSPRGGPRGFAQRAASRRGRSRRSSPRGSGVRSRSVASPPAVSAAATRARAEANSPTTTPMASARAVTWRVGAGTSCVVMVTVPGASQEPVGAWLNADAMGSVGAVGAAGERATRVTSKGPPPNSSRHCPRAASLAKGSSARPRSLTDGKRCAGSRSSDRRTARSSVGGTSPRSAAIGAIGACTTWCSTSNIESPLNSRRPERHSYRITPSANWSLLASMARDSFACSGDMYWGVPSSALVRVSPPSPSAPPTLAMPKSRSIGCTTPGLGTESIKLPGLRSRWTIPAAWVAATADSTGSIRSTADVTGSASSRRRRAVNVSPSRYSITRKGAPPSIPTSNTPTMCGCSRAAVACASWRKRAFISGCCAMFGCSTLTATRLPRGLRVASYTAPKAPAPSARTIW